MTIEQARAAYRAGLRRRCAALARVGHKDTYGFTPSEPYARYIDGMSAVAEQMVALALGRAWLSDGVVPDPPGAGDVDGGIGVRWTRHWNGHLIVHNEDADHLRIVLVTGALPPLTIAGWLPATEAKRPVFWRTVGVRHPAYFVPQYALRPFDTIQQFL